MEPPSSPARLKVALLLTGQLRTFHLVKYFHKHQLLAHYDTDVFLSIDKDNSRQNEFQNSRTTTPETDIQDAVAFFQPVRTYVLDHDTWPQQSPDAGSWTARQCKTVKN